MSDTLKRDLEFLYEIGCFRLVSRTWAQFQNPLAANNVEHTFRVIWIALMLAEHENGAIDREKLMKLGLIHDIPESRTGDLHYLSRMYVKRNENLALRDMVKGTVLSKDLMKLWKEYKQHKSPEARIVKDADILDVDLELSEMRARGNTLGSIFAKDHRHLVARTLSTESAKKLWRQIQSDNPHDWHLKGRNRINNGDWKKLRNKVN